MNRDQEEFLQGILNEYFEDLLGQPPIEADYLDRVKIELVGDNPFSSVASKQTDEFARQVFRCFEIRAVEGADTATKKRDAQANWNNRRYVDGSF